ncbi:hypothetical protein HAL1_19471 [Halomonas sp. HAL1]|nr:hypothetical protein HAL1_19471 [Halomonas sp. HAL1]
MATNDALVDISAGSERGEHQESKQSGFFHRSKRLT